MIRYAVVTLAMGLLAATPARGQLPDWVQRTTVSGLAFGDVYGMAANHADSLDGATGMWFRRVYLTVDNRLSDNTAFRLRYEMNSPGDFVSAGSLTPYVKDLYVRWTRGRHQVFLGIQPTPTFDLIEQVFGYRDVEKTPVDLQRIQSSRDIGVGVRGSIDAGQRLRYHALVGNGSGIGAETNKGKAVYLALSFHPSDRFVVQAYADRDDRPGNTDRSILQLFAAYQGPRARLGAHWTRQERRVATGPSTELALVSGFGSYRTSDKLAFLARVDRVLDANGSASGIAYLPMVNSARSTLLIAGIDYTVNRRFHLIPNIEAVSYEAVGGGAAPANDLMLRTTISVTF